MKQVIKHKDVGLLNMIRRTDPVIHTLSDNNTSGAISPDYKNAFMGCTSLETILVDEENPSMKSIYLTHLKVPLSRLKAVK